MKPILSLFNVRSPGSYFLGLLVVCGVLALSACGAGSTRAQIYDNAHVLNSSKVVGAASRLQNPLAIYTTNTFQGNQLDFERTARAKLGNDPDKIVMAIDTAHRYVYIVRGSNVPLSGSEINQAVNTFSSNYHDGDYTGASLAAINSMQRSMQGTTTGSAFSPALCWCIVPLLLILGAILLFAARRSQVTRGMFGQGPIPRRPPYMPPDQRREYTSPEQFRDQEPYSGSPERGRGSPWLAGGLGAAAGGLAGYELGKLRGERSTERGERAADTSGQFGNNIEGERDSGAGERFGGSNGEGERDFGGNSQSGAGEQFGGDDQETGDQFGAGGQFGNGDKDADGEMGGGGAFGEDDFTGNF
ncbi:MAG TPA: hypothetical protein VKV19_00710 [Ktedonobacteraceae bacterium]|nr:hypothetical protein [Ktedonobacteraceae bacterium]